MIMTAAPQARKPWAAKPPRFRLAPDDSLEVDIHEQCARVLDRLLAEGVEWACYPAGHIKLAPAELARLQRAGLKRAWPDFLIVHQGIYGLECKRDGATLSKTRVVRTKRGSPRILIGQEEMFPRLLRAGFRDIRVARSVEQMVQHLEDWRIPVRGRIAA